VVFALTDVPTARRAIETAARAAGLCAADVADVGLAAAELASNLARYAPGGVLLTTPASMHCLRLVSADNGPGITDVEAALRDGYSTGGSLGCGLGAVRRLMDHFDLQTSPAGTRIETYKCCTHRTL
jgi:anti-sigma regulatory factor (Ser/Thr protein kinase)